MFDKSGTKIKSFSVVKTYGVNRQKIIVERKSLKYETSHIITNFSPILMKNSCLVNSNNRMIISY